MKDDKGKVGGSEVNLKGNAMVRQKHRMAAGDTTNGQKLPESKESEQKKS